ncbi:hypothetical protein FSP39_003728 [Pinctada imbricata]|uniref:CCHC-type domain-containing protein n=1 Tax=Pinctada imbricata TaxID=66713 RepID=A0AA88XHG5_PINIB|nr:hypothetical protein FSP39_003728 [Pinctada imbricata]
MGRKQRKVRSRTSVLSRDVDKQGSDSEVGSSRQETPEKRIPDLNLNVVEVTSNSDVEVTSTSSTGSYASLNTSSLPVYTSLTESPRVSTGLPPLYYCGGHLPEYGNKHGMNVGPLQNQVTGYLPVSPSSSSVTGYLPVGPSQSSFTGHLPVASSTNAGQSSFTGHLPVGPSLSSFTGHLPVASSTNAGQSSFTGHLPVGPSLSSFTGHLPVASSTNTGQSSFTGHLPVASSTNMGQSSFTGHLPVTSNVRSSQTSCTGHLPVASNDNRGQNLSFGHLPIASSQIPFTGHLPVASSQASFTGHLPVASSQASFTGHLPVASSQTPFTGHLPVASSQAPFTGHLPLASSAGLGQSPFTGHLPVSSNISIGQASFTGYLPVSYNSRVSHTGSPLTGYSQASSSNPTPYTGTVPVNQNVNSIPCGHNGSVVNAGTGNTSTSQQATDNIATLIQQEVQRAIQASTMVNQTQQNDTNANHKYTSSESETDIPSIPRRRRNNSKLPRIPSFTGKEDWKIWLGRFEETAERRGWGTEDRLDHLLPLMLDDAADFVYGQLSKATRRDYCKLISELGNRFRVVETRKTYAVRFSNRQQKSGEKPEAFAADLKRLYDKAHPDRNRETREEDLLRHFLDGLSDPDAQFHIEYIKDPTTIDEAVLQVVTFEESGRQGHKRGKTVRQVKADSQKSYSDGDEPSQSGSNPDFRKQIKGNNSYRNSQVIQELNAEIQSLKKELEKHKSDKNQDGGQKIHDERDGNPNNPSKGQRHGHRERICYCCRQPGHFARECPTNNQ